MSGIMGEFFRGWKRKTGLVTLVMACVFAVGWVRCFSIKDSFNISVGQKFLLNLVSDPGVLVLFQISVGPDTEAPKPVPFWTTQNSGDSTMLFESSRSTWQITTGAIWFAMSGDEIGGSSPASFHSIQAPYWSIVLPLTFFSAWCLLSPRPQKPHQ